METSILKILETSDSLFSWRKLLNMPNAVSMESYTRVKQPFGGTKRVQESSQVTTLLTELCTALGLKNDFKLDEIVLLRDANGRPFLHWPNASRNYAERNDIRTDSVHITNTNDGGISLFFAAYDMNLLGVGIDIIALSRVQSEHKNRDYILRFVRHFMSDRELQLFEDCAASDTIETLRVRSAAHFSLMESISKAFGTGLKIGAGMGRPISLPKQSIGISRIEPEVEVILETPAIDRMKIMGADRVEAHWGFDDNFLVSAAFLWKNC